MLVDKHNWLPRIGSLAEVTLELGCGNMKRHPEAIGVDAIDSACTDLVGDVFEVLESIPDHSVSAVHSYHFFEHVADTGRLVDNLARVLRSGGTLHTVVPHFSNPFYYSDPTHQTFFGLYSFCYYADQNLFTRTTPHYGRSPEFRLVGANLKFKSYRPRYVRHAAKRAFEKLVNTSRYIQELYEENLTWMLPCYEIEYFLERK